MKEFKQVRESLIDMLEDLDNRLDKITNDVNLINESITEDPEQHAAEKDKEKTEASSKNLADKEINKMKQAISKINNGTYGICLSCGQPINKEYLEVVPFSNRCIHCAEK